MGHPALVNAGLWRRYQQILFGEVLWAKLCAPPHAYVEVLTPDVLYPEIVFFNEVIKVKWGHKGGVLIR